jgi:hypothetical protein
MNWLADRISELDNFVELVPEQYLPEPDGLRVMPGMQAFQAVRLQATEEVQAIASNTFIVLEGQFAWQSRIQTLPYFESTDETPGPIDYTIALHRGGHDMAIYLPDDSRDGYDVQAFVQIQPGVIGRVRLTGELSNGFGLVTQGSVQAPRHCSDGPCGSAQRCQGCAGCECRHFRGRDERFRNRPWYPKTIACWCATHKCR